MYQEERETQDMFVQERTNHHFILLLLTLVLSPYTFDRVTNFTVTLFQLTTTNYHSTILSVFGAKTKIHRTGVVHFIEGWKTVRMTPPLPLSTTLTYQVHLVTHSAMIIVNLLVLELALAIVNTSKFAPKSYHRR